MESLPQKHLPTSKTVKSLKVDTLPSHLKKLAQELIDAKFPVDTPKKESPKKLSQKADEYVWDGEAIKKLQELSGRDLSRTRYEYGMDFGREDPRYRLEYRNIEYEVTFSENFCHPYRLSNGSRIIIRAEEGEDVAQRIDRERYRLAQLWDCSPRTVDVSIKKRRL